MSDTGYFQAIYLAGATGSGKTGVAIELCRRLGEAEVINADAFQVIRGIETLSAAPQQEEKKGVRHHLFGIFEIDEVCDAARFATLARTQINRVASYAVPVVVGGSGLYLKSITHGLAPTPPGDPELRAKLEQEPLDALAERYRLLDPEGAKKTNLKNRRYVTRNLEICLLTGEPASRLKAGWEIDDPELVGIYLQRSREDTYERINRRTLRMFEDGVVEEVRALDREPSATAVKAIGLRDIRDLNEGLVSRGECVARIQQVTRRYAKRQETWFKKETGFRPIPCQPDDDVDSIVDRILDVFPLSQLRSLRDNPPCLIS